MAPVASGKGSVRRVPTTFTTIRTAKSRPGRPLRFAGAVGAVRRLPCDARSRGPVAELAAFAALSTLRHLRRVRGGSALRARAASPALLGAPEALRDLPGRAFAPAPVFFAATRPAVARGRRCPSGAL